MPPKLKNTSSSSGPSLIQDLDGDASSTPANYMSTENVMLLIDKITTNFNSTFSSCVEKIVCAIEKRVEQRMDCQSGEIFELNKKVDQAEKQNKNLESIINQQNEKIN